MTPTELAEQIEIYNIGSMNGPGLSQAQINLLATVKGKRMVCAALRACETARSFVTLANRVAGEALPKFEWGKSALDANAISLLNEFLIEAPRAHVALAELEKVTQ